MTNEQYTEFLQRTALKAKGSFFAFVKLIDSLRALPHKLIVSECHKYLIQLIQDIEMGRRGKRHAVSMPPQHGKSTFLSVLAVAWIMGRREGINIAITGFSYQLMCDFSMQVKSIMRMRIYQVIFPGVTVEDTPDRLDYWKTSNGGVLRAKSVGKKLTGSRVDWLIIDDALAGREEADSKIQRERVVRWYLADCRSRLSPEAVVFLIGTRFHPEDLIGVLTNEDYIEILETFEAEEEIFEFTNMTAICENPETDPLGRKEGEALFPEMRDLKFLQNIKAAFAARNALYEWESQYMGNPIITGGGVVETDNLRVIEYEDVPEGLEHVRGYDLAASEKQLADYTAGARLAYDETTDTIYIIDVCRNKLNWPKNQKLIVQRGKDEKIRIRIEAVAGFLACYQTVRLELEGICLVSKSVPKGDKLARANRWLPKVEGGKVCLVRGTWNKEFIEELKSFPVGNHDDMVDSISIAWEMLMHRDVAIRQTKRTRAAGRARPWRRAR